MERIETIRHKGKDVIYFDLSNIGHNDELMSVVESAKEVISEYAHNSVYTITNITNIAFDTKTKEMAAEWMSFNKPYVIYCAIVGVDGIKRIMVNAVIKLSGRRDVKIFLTKDKAVEWFECCSTHTSKL